MNPFLYFLPNRNVLTPADAAAVGLAYAFETSIDCAQVQNGPGGQHGIVCAQIDTYGDGQLGYHADRQVWIQIPGSDIHVGHYRGQLPTPDDLLRKKPLGGRQLELDDGQAWLCPLARSYSEKMEGDDLAIYWHVQLPQRLELAADGRWTNGSVTKRYAALWEMTEGWQRTQEGQATDADRQRFDYQGKIDAATLCLQANYRLGRMEAHLLGLFNDDLIDEILDTAIDVQKYLSLIQKKMAREAVQTGLGSPSTPPALPNSSVGPAAEILTTDPPAATSPCSPPA